MPPLRRTPGAGHGLLLLRGSAGAATKALRRGLVAVHLVDLPGWTGVCLADSRARSAAPYDVGLEVLAARPVPRAQRPALGFFVLDGSAVVTAHPRGWRSEQSWLVWQPGVGPRHTPDLTPLTPQALLTAAGADRRTTTSALAEAFADPSGSALDLLVTLVRLLGLPGEELLRHGAEPDDLVIEPSVRSVRAFDALVARDFDDEPGAPVRGGRAG